MCRARGLSSAECTGKKAEIVKVLEKLDKGEVSPKLEKSPKA